MTPTPLCQLCVQRVLEECENPTPGMTQPLEVRRGTVLQRWVVPYEDEQGVTGADEVTVAVCARCAHHRSRFLQHCCQQEIDLALAHCDGPRARREGRLVC